MGLPYQPKLKDYGKQPEFKSFRNFLARELGAGGIDAEQAARTAAMSSIGSQTANAQDMARRASISTMGANNPGGFLPAMQSQIQLAAPYAQAEQQAKIAGKQSMQNAGQAYQNLQQARMNWWVSGMQPYLTASQIQNQAAMMAASGGGGFDWKSLIGPGLGAAAALAL